jgi:hypothetical protein
LQPPVRGHYNEAKVGDALNHAGQFRWTMNRVEKIDDCNPASSAENHADGTAELCNL